MKKENKSEALIEAERQEAEFLTKKILECTSRIPPKIVNEASYQAAVNFKALATSARKVAESRNANVTKLRHAWSAISSYYA
jgi:hypothetical protein